MNERMNLQPSLSLALPLFVLSFRHRDELASTTAKFDWHPIAARRSEGAEQRFIASGAQIAIVDARGAFEEGLAGVRMLAEAVDANAAALLVLVSKNDIPKLDAVLEAGATHYLASPFGEAELGQALRFADRYVARIGGDFQGPRLRQVIGRDSALIWRFSPISRGVEANEGVIRLFGVSSVPVTFEALTEAMSAEDRALACAAFARVAEAHLPTAFVHGLLAAPEARFAQHLRFEDGRVVATMEPLDAADSDRDGSGRDPLTGLANQLAARRWIIRSMGRPDQPILAMLISINQFEMINTGYGRSTGDALLQALSRRIAPLIREAGGKNALFGRMAGSEFVVGVSEPLSPDRATMLAQSLLAAVQRPFPLGETTITMDCRIGAVFSLPQESDESALLRRATAALAEAKASDRDQIILLSAADADRAAYSQDLEADLRRALDRGEIDVLFQPQVGVADGRIVGVEALARWEHPAHGTLGAVTLFSAAARSNYVEPLSAHVQRRALEIAAQWTGARAKLRVSINVTSADIARDGFVARFLEMVDASGFPRKRLTVEITEDGLIEDLGNAAALLAELRAQGCRVAIDDFGTGYSSLAYLKALPLDYLKIDKRLAEDISGSARDRVVVRGVIDMARSLGLSVIAEGVETEEQLGLLAREGCTYYQGFLCAEPLKEQQLGQLLEDWKG